MHAYILSSSTPTFVTTHSGSAFFAHWIYFPTILHYPANKGLASHSYGFSSSYVWMWELDYKQSWALKNWCFWTVVLEMTLESPLDWKETQPDNPKGNQSWMFIGRTDAEAETPILWLPDAKDWLIGRHWWWDRLKAGGRDGWMASPTQWRWVWVNSGSWWWTGRPRVLQTMGLQRVGHDWVTELNWSSIRFLGGSGCKESAYNAGDLGLIPGLGRSPGEGKGNTKEVIQHFHYMVPVLEERAYNHIYASALKESHTVLRSSRWSSRN